MAARHVHVVAQLHHRIAGVLHVGLDAFHDAADELFVERADGNLAGTDVEAFAHLVVGVFGPLHDFLDAQPQHFQTVGLGDVVGGAFLQSADNVFLAALGREQDDGDV